MTNTITYDEPGVTYDDPCYLYDGLVASTIIYDEPGVTYDDPCYLYDGINICICTCPPQPPVQPVQQRPGYWIGRSSERRREEEELRRKRKFLSVSVQARPLSVNGYDLDLDVKEIRFAGEDDETRVEARPTKFAVAEDRYQVDSAPLATSFTAAPIDPEIDSEGVMEGDILPETEGAFLGLSLHSALGSDEEVEDAFQVIGGLSGEEDFFVEAMVLTGSSQDLTLSCLPVTSSIGFQTKTENASIFSIAPETAQAVSVVRLVVTNGGTDKDPKDEG